MIEGGFAENNFNKGAQMNIHSGARTCPASRALMVRRVLKEGWKATEAAEAAGVSRQTVYKWVARAKQGDRALEDRSSRPHRSPRQTAKKRKQLVVELRKSQMSGRAIATKLRMARSTVSRILRRAKLSRARDLRPKVPIRRYEKKRPGELLHVDIKQLGKFHCPGHRVTNTKVGQNRGPRPGWEYVHVAVDDHSRLAYVEVLEDGTAFSASRFIERAVAWFATLGIRIERVMTDNGRCYTSHLFRGLLQRLHIRHVRTQIYTPRTNGKAERFIRTLSEEWAHIRPYASSAYRRRALKPWLRRYNYQRPHGSLDGLPPISRV